MNSLAYQVDTQKYAKCIEGSKRIRWDIDRDVIRGRDFDLSMKFLPDGLTGLAGLDFVDDIEKRLLSQIQGRTYAKMFGFVERFITAKMLEVSRVHWLGDQTALEAVIRFCDEELKHQALFVIIDRMMESSMPPGYTFDWDTNEVASAVLARPSWTVMALIYEIELFTQEHYKQSMAPDPELSDLFKDIFLYHWKEEAHHAVIDALEWPRIDSGLSDAERDEAVDELIELVGELDTILQGQARADAVYFLKIIGRDLTDSQMERLQAALLSAYRGQYIFSGVRHEKFQSMLGNLANKSQIDRLERALATLM
jgi:hypothetical protein